MISKVFRETPAGHVSVYVTRPFIVRSIYPVCAPPVPLVSVPEATFGPESEHDDSLPLLVFQLRRTVLLLCTTVDVDDRIGFPLFVDTYTDPVTAVDILPP